MKRNRKVKRCPVCDLISGTGYQWGPTEQSLHISQETVVKFLNHMSKQDSSNLLNKV